MKTMQLLKRKWEERASTRLHATRKNKLERTMGLNVKAKDILLPEENMGKYFSNLGQATIS